MTEHEALTATGPACLAPSPALPPPRCLRPSCRGEWPGAALLCTADPQAVFGGRHHRPGEAAEEGFCQPRGRPETRRPSVLPERQDADHCLRAPERTWRPPTPSCSWASPPPSWGPTLWRPGCTASPSSWPHGTHPGLPGRLPESTRSLACTGAQLPCAPVPCRSSGKQPVTCDQELTPPGPPGRWPQAIGAVLGGLGVPSRLAP